MRILWVVTKPPWPPRDGGRLLVWHTLEALASDGHRVDLVSPCDPRDGDPARVIAALSPVCEPHLVAAAAVRGPMALMRARCGGVPLPVARHASTAVRDVVERLCAADRFDVLHAEQLQSLPQCAPARQLGVPVVLRAQNVETDLWSALAAARPALAPLVRHEARRLARYEARAVREAAATVALTARDAQRLAALAAGGGRVYHVAAPFPARLPAGADSLPGAPPVVVLGTGWWPGRQGATWLAGEAWPAVRARCPGAVLHVFGPGARASRAPGIERHPAPADSAAAFPPGAILAVPLSAASGVRMKILEAWARGTPVVATPEAVAGLDGADGDAYLVAASAVEIAAAVERLHREPGLAARVVEAGRAVLRARHDPRRVGRALAEVYARAGTAV